MEAKLHCMALYSFWHNCQNIKFVEREREGERELSIDSQRALFEHNYDGFRHLFTLEEKILMFFFSIPTSISFTTSQLDDSDYQAYIIVKALNFFHIAGGQ